MFNGRYEANKGRYTTAFLVSHYRSFLTVDGFLAYGIACVGLERNGRWALFFESVMFLYDLGVFASQLADSQFASCMSALKATISTFLLFTATKAIKTFV